MNKAFWIILIVILLASGFYYYNKQKEESVVTSFETCVAAGNPVLESYPRQCKTPDGKTFTELITTPQTGSVQNEVPQTPERVRGAEDATLAIGEIKTVAGLQIKVADVSSDNRCPIDVTCIQAGKAVVAIVLGEGATEQNASVSLPGEPLIHAGYSVSIINITPVPNTKIGPINKKDYAITFYVVPTASGNNL